MAKLKTGIGVDSLLVESTLKRFQRRLRTVEKHLGKLAEEKAALEAGIQKLQAEGMAAFK